MRPFRFHIPFFSNKSPSGTSSPSPPPTPPPPPPPPPPSRPPFRPAGIAQPLKPETKSKVSPSLARAKSNVRAIAASSPSPSRGAPTPNRQLKQSNQQSGSQLKKPESPRTDQEQKVTREEKSSREAEKKANENIKPVIKKPPIIARPEGHSERKEAEAAPEKQKKTELEKLAVQESKTVLHEGGQEKSKARENRETAQQAQQKRKDKEKLDLQETKRSDLHDVGREDATRSKTTRPVSAALQSPRGLRDRGETEIKAQSRTEIDAGDSQRKGKGVSMGTHGEGSSSMGRRIKEDIRDGISKLTWGKSNSDEKFVSVVTLTGENRGATMGIGSEKDKKDGEVHIRRGYRSNPDESPNSTVTETEGRGRRIQDKNPKREDNEEAKIKAYVNGNTQGINNSLIIESSVNENDPGVHMSFKFEESKKEIISPPKNVPEKKLVTTERNEPRVRSRCLRGLLAESSESETKPRRHGCRFTCKDKDKESGLF